MFDAALDDVAVGYGFSAHAHMYSTFAFVRLSLQHLLAADVLRILALV